MSQPALRRFRASFARGEGLPLWDRSECGGRPLLPNPETQLLSGLVAGALDVGGDVMERWYPTLGVVVAVTGVYAWGRRVFALGAVPALFAGAVFGAVIGGTESATARYVYRCTAHQVSYFILRRT